MTSRGIKNKGHRERNIAGPLTGEKNANLNLIANSSNDVLIAMVQIMVHTNAIKGKRKKVEARSLTFNYKPNFSG